VEIMAMTFDHNTKRLGTDAGIKFLEATVDI